MQRNNNKLKIIANIRKNVYSKSWKCNVEGCSKLAINSHLLQRNGILNKIAENGHLIELKNTDVFRWELQSAPIEFKRVGIGSALSLPLFCKDCDSSIFKRIEKCEIDFSDYESLLLLCYRTVCAEQRKKEQVVEVYRRILNSEMLKGQFDREYPTLFLKGNELGIKDLEKFKFIIQQEIKASSDRFHFVTYKYPLIKVYGSAVFSVYDEGDVTEEERTQFDDVFIHVIPSDSELIIVCGYMKEFNSKWITEYVESWKGLDYQQLTQNLTNLFSSRIENWGLAPSLFQNIPHSTVDKMINFWSANAMNLSKGLTADFDFFKDESKRVT